MNKSVEERANEIIENAIPLMEVSGVLTHTEAYDRGSKLLTAQARLNSLWKELADKLVLAKSVEEMQMHEAVSKAEGRDAEARKAAAKANPDRQEAAQKVSLIENNIHYVQSFSRQFENAYRLMTYMVKGIENA